MHRCHDIQTHTNWHNSDTIHSMCTSTWPMRHKDSTHCSQQNCTKRIIPPNTFSHTVESRSGQEHHTRSTNLDSNHQILTHHNTTYTHGCPHLHRGYSTHSNPHITHTTPSLETHVTPKTTTYNINPLTHNTQMTYFHTTRIYKKQTLSSKTTKPKITAHTPNIPTPFPNHTWKF